MKIIDLLNKIANGERVPEKIKFDNEVWFYDNQQKDYITGVQEFTLGETKNLIYCINAEVEILETTLNTKNMNVTVNKIEKLDLSGYDDTDTGNFEEWTNEGIILAVKINEIIDHLNNK